MSLENKDQSKAIDTVYQAHMTLYLIDGGGAMSPTKDEVENAVKVVEEATPYIREQALKKFEDALKLLRR